MEGDTENLIIGKYKLERNENLDEFFIATGVPYLPRKLLLMSSPVIEISRTEDGKWTIKNSTMLRTTQYTFNIGEEYNEVMPGNRITPVTVYKSITTIEENKLITNSTSSYGANVSRIHEFSEVGLVLTLHDEKSGQSAKRYFIRMI